MSRAVKAVLFDAVGTLIEPCPSVGEAYAAAAACLGLTVATDEVARRFRQAFDAEERFDAETLAGRTDSDRELQRWRRIVGQVYPDAPRPEELFRQLWLHFAEPGHWRLFPDVAPVLEWLDAQGVAWGIASNFDDRLRGICQHLPELSRCQHLFLSSEIGWRKPSPEYFRAVERELRLGPPELLLIGDDVENDFLAVQAAGWGAAWLHRERIQSPADPRVPAASTIALLTELALRGDLAAFGRNR